MIKKKLFYLFYIFLQFYLASLRGTEYFAKLANSQEPEPGVFGSLEPERSRLKKKPGSGAGAAWEKNQEPEPLEKKKQEPEPELKNLPAPQPCLSLLVRLFECHNHSHCRDIV